MTAYLYAFEAKEIQSFVFRSPRLRDMAGGSELVNRLCRDFLDESLRVVCGEDTYQVLSRAAGGARVRFLDKDSALTFYAMWPLLVDRVAPGVRVVQSCLPLEGTVEDAVNDAREALRAARNSPVPVLPELGPLVDRSPLTGGAGVEWSGPAVDRELVDAGVARRRRGAGARTSLLQRFTGESDPDERRWPLDFDQIARTGEDDVYLAVVHADGNELGSIIGGLLRGAPGSQESQLELFNRFSRAVAAATEGAAQVAYQRVVALDRDARVADQTTPQPGACFAARPIVLGGDDLTVVLRADLAIAFLEVFLEAFERESTRQFEVEGLTGRPGIPVCLTACAGIAFVKRNYPFVRASHLSESLCKAAKSAAKRGLARGSIVPSCFSFHRITASIADDFDDLRSRELIGADGVALHAGPYAVGDHSGTMRRLAALRKAASCIGTRMLPTGTIRGMVSELYRSRDAVTRLFERMLEVHPDVGRSFSAALVALGGDPKAPLFVGDSGPALLPDIHVFRVIGDPVPGGSDA